MRKSLSLLVAAAAVAGSIFAASPAQAWTCAYNEEVIPEVVGDTACTVVLTTAGVLCKVKICFY
jgi:uncharacterized protein (DUF697 family)